MVTAARTISPTSRGRWADRALRGWVLLPLGLLGVLGLSRVLYPYGLGPAEATSWAPATLFIHGHDPYTMAHAARPPFVDAIFGPAFYLVVGVCVLIGGDHFLLTRLLSVAEAVAIAAAIHGILRACTDGRRWAWLGVGLFAVQWPVLEWVGVQRPDLQALACGVGALALLVGRDPRTAPGLARAAAAGALAAAGLLSRQSEVLPILVGIGLLLGVARAPRAAVLFGGVAVGLTAAVIGLLLISSRGQAWTFLVSAPAHSPRDLGMLGRLLGSAARQPVCWVDLLLLGFAARGLLSGRLGLLWLGWLLLAAVIGADHAATAGGSVNDFLEPVTVAALALPFGLAHRPARRGAGRAWVLALLVAAAGLIGAVPVLHGELLRWRGRGYDAGVVAAVHRLTPRGGSVFAIDPAFVSAARRRDVFNDPPMYDGRTPRLAAAYRRALGSGAVATLVLGGAELAHVPAGYRRVRLPVAAPGGVGRVGVFTRATAR